MTATKDAHPARPSSQHRLSIGANGSHGVVRPSLSRPHAHSISLGSLSSAHRINRRKSSSSNIGVNMSALAAAAKEASLDTSAFEKSIPEVEGLGIHTEGESIPTCNGSNAVKSTHAEVTSNSIKGSAIIDGPSLSSMINNARANLDKSRIRRASEGSRVAKGDRPKSSAGELRCETCGKGYKHGSCLTKHLWEHTPEWALTSKLLISKHQQVQLLEAASVLMAMNQDGSPSIGPVVHHDSDLSSDSPAPSGSSEFVDEDEMSSRTSTPSQQDEHSRSRHFPKPRRQDSYSSVYSRSYQSSSSLVFAASSAPNDSSGFAHYQQWSSSHRPMTAGAASDHDDLASAAQGLLNCSLSTPNHQPTNLDDDVPPVPPLPAQYSKQNNNPSPDLSAVPNLNQGFDDQHQSYAHRSYYELQDVDMESTQDDDEEGVFGQMEQ